MAIQLVDVDMLAKGYIGVGLRLEVGLAVIPGRPR